MVVLGIAPGLKSLAYAVVGWTGEERGDLIDADVLRGTKANREANLAALLHKSRPHRLIMSVVFERNPPAALALGPPYSRKEPELHVMAVRQVMSMMAVAIRVPVISFPDKKTLLSGFSPERHLGNISCAHVRAESLQGNTALLVATVTAIAAAKQIRSSRIEVV